MEKTDRQTDLEGITLSKISQTERKTKILYDITYMQTVKKKKQKTELVETENRMVVARGYDQGNWGDVGQRI